jgi:tryptophan synthase alpha chain
MGRISESFKKLRQNREKALVGFVTAGDPDFETSKKIILSMCYAGMDILELGIPFSDPSADGPVIQRSSMRALKKGMTMAKAFEMVREIRKHHSIPIVLFSYYNPVLAYGAAKFQKDAMDAGADGVLIVDLPPEESSELTSQWDGREFPLIRLIAPTTGPDRAKMIASGAEGFIYLISKTGVTGSGGLDTSKTGEYAEMVRKVTDMPLCTGFGISKPEDAKALAAYGDGIVIGSAFERAIEENIGNAGIADKLAGMVRSFKEAIKIK